MGRTRWCFVVFALAGCGNSASGSKVGAVDAGSDGTLAVPADVASTVDFPRLADTASDGSPAAPEATPADRAVADSLAADAAQAAPDSALRDLGLDSLDGAARVDLRAADGPVDGPVPDGGADRGASSDLVANLDAVTGLVAVSYSNDLDTIFANPERGFYAAYETYASSYESLSQSALQVFAPNRGSVW